jgi:hypothetical protein
MPLIPFETGMPQDETVAIGGKTVKQMKTEFGR